MHAAGSGGTKRILVLNGHPDAGKAHFGDALLSAYADAAQRAGHSVDILNITDLDFPLIRSKDDWETTAPCADILDAQQRVQRAQHIVLLYPLWLGDMPAVLKAFLEQLLRPGFAFGTISDSKLPEKKLRGRSARVVVTMGMPAFFYRWFYGAHSLRSLRRNILSFCGIGPVRTTLIGLVESEGTQRRLAALRKMEEYGAAAR